MKLDGQVTSLELSKRLHALAELQTSIFYWVENKGDRSPIIVGPNAVDRRAGKSFDAGPASIDQGLVRTGNARNQSLDRAALIAVRRVDNAIGRTGLVLQQCRSSSEPISASMTCAATRLALPGSRTTAYHPQSEWKRPHRR
jgi:hypothetical protein